MTTSRAPGCSLDQVFARLDMVVDLARAHGQLLAWSHEVGVAGGVALDGAF